MNPISKRITGLRVAPLSAALSLALFMVPTAESHAALLDVAMPATWKAGDGSGVAALMQSLQKVAAARKPSVVAAPPASAQVTSCADDGSVGTLREVIAAAGEGDRLDLSQLQCSVITLTQGAIPVLLDNLSLVGPGADRLAIDGNRVDRIFVHYGYDTLDLENLTIRNGFNQVSGYHVAGGGCIVGNGYITLDYSVVSGCTAVGEGAYGGAILARGGTLYSSTLSGNLALGSHPSTFTAAYGGGIMAYRGTAALYDSTVTGNRAAHERTDTNGSYCTGGGIFADNGGYSYASTISHNYSYGTGGGIASHGGFFISQSTISGNIAHGKKGGGLFVRLFNSMSIYNATIADNKAIDGGGMYFSGQPQSITLQSTLVANNVGSAAGRDIAAQNPLTIAGSHNLVLSTGNIVMPADTLHGSPALLPLAYNGGPTQTHALSFGSAALNAGSNPLGFSYDQRGSGFPRQVDAAPDIGAFEGVVAAAPMETVPASGPGMLGLLIGLLVWFGLIWHQKPSDGTTEIASRQ